MNTKLLLAALAAGVAAFLLGWIIFGMALMGYYEANMIQYEGLMKGEGEMGLGLLFLSNLCFAALVSWVTLRTGNTSLVGGAITGTIIGFLFYLSVDLSFLAMMNFFANSTMVVVDVIANTVWAAGTGAVAGLVLGSGKKAD